jgi:hypothetical protein
MVLKYNRTLISLELTRLLARQTRFLHKSEPTPKELQEFEQSVDRIRELFTELEQSNKAA